MLIEGGRRRFFLKHLIRASVLAWCLNILRYQLQHKLTKQLGRFLPFLALLMLTSTVSALCINSGTSHTHNFNLKEDSSSNYYQRQNHESGASATSISDLEKQLSMSESQRVEQSKSFNRKLLSVILLALVLGVSGIVFFILFKKFKKQKKQLARANAEVQRVNEHLEELVSKRTSQLLETNKELDTFLYKSSHDLRRPLTTIVGLGNIARMTLGKESHELFEKASHTARQMDKMLKKLIAVNNIHHPSTYSPINFEKQAQTSIHQLEDIISDGKVKVDLAIEPELQYTSYPEIIEIILKNLLENAIWFSTLDEEQSSPSVLLNISQVNSHISILVQDNGPGVKENFRNSIWEMFYVGHEKSNGNGLGLYLAKKAVKVLDGTIDLKPDEPLTTFEVILPVHNS